MAIRRTGGSSSPHVEQIEPTDKWRFTDPWRIEVDGIEFLFLPGFEYDRASIPQAAQWAITKDQLGTAAPAVHDAIFRFDGRMPVSGTVIAEAAKVGVFPNRRYSRADANRAFYDILLERGVPKWRAWCAYQAVCWFSRRW